MIVPISRTEGAAQLDPDQLQGTALIVCQLHLVWLINKRDSSQTWRDDLDFENGVVPSLKLVLASDYSVTFASLPLSTSNKARRGGVISANVTDTARSVN